jgi:hypothetical protein
MIYNGIAILPTRKEVTGVPAAPSSLTATTDGGFTRIDLAWTDNSNNEDGFKIERSPDGSTGWSQIDTVGANIASYTNTGLTAGNSYYYRVRAYAGGDNSAYSNTDNDTIFDLDNDISWDFVLRSDTDVFSDAGSTPAVDDDPIQQWDDQSGNGRDASCGGCNDATAPLWLDDRMNSLSSTRFTTADRMRITDFAHGTTDLTSFVVFREIGGSVTGTMFSQWDLGTNDKAFFVQPSSNKFRVVLSGDGSTNDKDYSSATDIAESGMNIGVFVFDSGTLNLYVDGKDQTETKSVDNAIASVYSSAADLMLGCVLNNDSPTSHVSDAYISGIWLIGSALNATQRGQTEDAIREIWGLDGVPTTIDGVDRFGGYSNAPIINSDASIHEIGNILQEPADSGEEYKTWFTTGSEGTTDERINYAYSSNGTSWTEYGSNPVIAARYEDPYVLKVGSTYYMYVEDKENQGANDYVRRFSASNPEGAWSDDGRLTDGLGGDLSAASPVVWKDGATWYLIYERMSGNFDIGLATSSDGLDWTADGSNPVIDTADFAWNTGIDIVPDDIINKSGTYYLTVHGSNAAGDYFVSAASSANLTSWTEITGGPFSDDWGRQLNNVMIYNDGTDDVVHYATDDRGMDGIYRGFPLEDP